MKSLIKKIMSHGSVKNSFWIIGEKVIQMLISMLLTMISARYLGPENYGVLNYGTSFVTFFLSITKLGLDYIAVNELINDEKNEGKILGTSLVFRIFSSLVSIFLIFVCILILKPNQKIILVTTMLQSIVLIFQASSFLEFWFQKKLQSKYVSIAKSIAYIIASLYKLCLLFSKCSVEWFALSLVIDYFIICVILFLFYYKNKGPKLKFDFNFGLKLLSKSHHFIISGIMVVIYTQIDKIMIGNMINEMSVGVYSAALTMHSAFNFIPEAIVISSKPTIYNAKNNSNDLYIKRLKQTILLIFLSCSLFAIITTIFAKPIINLLFGEKYNLAVTPLIILVWSIPFAQLGNVRGIWIVSEGLNRYTKKYLMWGAIINIVLNYIFINKFQIVGAAVATLITEIAVCLIVPFLYKDIRRFPKMIFEAVFFNFN